MRVNLKQTEGIFPMPVLMVATYNEDGSVNVMNAAWGTMQDRDKVALVLTETHKTVHNIKARIAFTISIADADHIVQADYFGVVSGNKEPNKFANSGLTAEKSTYVDAPVISEFPLCLECEFIEYQADATGCGVIGKVVNISANEKVLQDGKINMSLVNAIAFDPYTHGYYKSAKELVKLSTTVYSSRNSLFFRLCQTTANFFIQKEPIQKQDRLFCFLGQLSFLLNILSDGTGASR